MHYEHLKLRPSNGRIDRDAIEAWLAAKDYAFRDPHGEDTWHLSATKREAGESRDALIANPTLLQYSTVIVFLDPDWVGVSAYRVHRALFRALEFIRWLVGNGDWEVRVDQSAWEPIGNPARLFPEDIDDKPDHTANDLTEGVRYTWRAGERTFVVHSSGQWRTWLRAVTDTSRLADASHGELSPSALTEWQTAVRNAGELIEYVEGNDATGSLEVENDEGIEKAWFDATAVPGSLKPVLSLVERWLGELATETAASTPADLLHVRKG